MATRLKTVEYCFPATASVVNNTLTTLTQITLYLPENTKTFQSVTAKVTIDDIVTATGGTVTTKTFSLRLAAVAYSTVSNANAVTHSGENKSLGWDVDYTAYFTTNWTGTSMTSDFQVTLNHSTGTTLDFVNCCVTLQITYSYDDTTATQVKTVAIPLNAPVGAMGTTKPAAIDTIPNLDTYLPERGKTYRQLYIVVEGMESRNAATTDHTMAMQIDTLTQLTTGNYEGALATDRHVRYVYDITGLGMTTNATHSWYIWASVARCNHFQVTLHVTYEFTYGTPTTTAWAATTAKSLNDRVYGTNASGKNVTFICTTAGTTGGTQPTWTITQDGTTADGSVTWTVVTVMNSVRLPFEFDGPIGGTTSSDYNRGKARLWISEKSVSGKKLAAYVDWMASTAMTGLNMRLGTGSFVAYTDISSVLAGTNCAMIRNDSAYTLARGRNNMVVDAYRTGTTSLGQSFSGYILVNYTSAQHRFGQGAHNHTVVKQLSVFGTGAGIGTNNEVAIAATGLVPPETAYWNSSLGVAAYAMVGGGASDPRCNVLVERLTTDNEGGLKRDALITAMGMSDTEMGIHRFWGEGIWNLFEQHPDEIQADRMWAETNRRYWINGIIGGWVSLAIMQTYHAISTYEVAGTISGSAGGTVTLALFDDSDGEWFAVTSRTGNGTYTFTWYDDTRNMSVSAVEDATHLGLSVAAVATEI